LDAQEYQEALDRFAKKGEEGKGVIAMINLLPKDLDKDMSEAEVMEKDAQATSRKK